LGEIEGEPAPAAADIQHGLARLEQQFGGEMALLLLLGDFETVVAGVEIGAGILPVVVQELAVEGVRQIIVMGHVALGMADRIVLLQIAQGALQAGEDAVYRVLSKNRMLRPQRSKRLLIVPPSTVRVPSI